MPSQVTKTVWKAKTRAGGIPQQTVDLTPKTATVTDRNPFWASDETTVLFDSNRKDLAGTTVDTRVHIYRMYADGSQVQAVTGPLASTPIAAGSSQSEPAMNSAGNSVVYIQNTPGDGTNLEVGSVDLMELNLATGVAKSLIANNPSGFSFSGLNHPEYGVTPGGNFAVIFAGRLQGQSNFSLFAVDTDTLVITQLTGLNGAVSDDRNPTQSPYNAANRNKLVIAFDSNRADAFGQTVKANRDVWVLPVGATNDAAPATKITTFQSGSAWADNIQPAWSTNKVDQVNSSQQFVNGRQLIAFATTRYDSNGDGNANGINPNGSHDIYWIRADIGLDTNYPAMGWYTVTSPETVTNAAIKLNTSDSTHVYDDVKPTWPQFIKTYRVAFQTNRTSYDEVSDTSQPTVPLSTTPCDIFASTLIDLNAPTLVRYNETTGDIVGVEPRIAQPGSTVKISVKLADMESGIRDVWVQVKNPNSKYQASDGVEHKVFIFPNLPTDPNDLILAVPVEYESQRVYIGSNPDSSQAYTYATPKYVASIDDVLAFSGGNHAPSDSDPLKDPGWLQLTLESRDPSTGVCTYSATWKTPQYASDFYIDVIAYDNAVDPFTADTSNWRIYDNIWGFSTQAFNPQAGILFVSDHSEGQKFFGSRFGSDTLVNVWNSFWGTESWNTDIDVNILPRQYQTGTNIYPLINVRNTMGVKSYGGGGGDGGTYTYQYDPATLDGTKVENQSVDVPVTQQYDIWRVQCRGPVPDALLQQYTPRTEQQPSDSTAGGTQTARNVLVSNRCVFWNAPYAGNLFQAPGSITDLATQSKLQSFVAAGGRLFVNGQDIGWAMTVNGSIASAFMSGVLKASFGADDMGGANRIIASGNFPLIFRASTAYALVSPSTGWNPIVNEVYRNIIFAEHQYPGPGYLPILTAPNWLVGGSPTEAHEYGCPGDYYPDGVTTSGNAVTDFTYTGTPYVALMHYEDTNTNTKVVYAPMGIEGYNNPMFKLPDNTGVLMNRRASLVHNAVCWMRTGVISGTVLDTEAKPLSGTLVRLLRGTTTMYTAITDSFGKFLINGVEPDNYIVSGVKAGYLTQKTTGVWVHGGGGRDDISIRMTPAEKASIKGQVTRFGSTTPVVGATITATEVVPVGGNTSITPTVVTGTSDANGNYIVANVPAGVKYTLTCAATGYGDSVPLSYTLPDATAGTTIAPATEYGPFNFALKAEQGVVEGTVVAWDANAPNNIGAPIAGAVVTATQGTTTVVATTDGSGNFSFNKTNATPNGLDPGTWGIVATAPGYAPNSPSASVTVVSGTVAVRPDQDPIKLKTVPPGAIEGLVTGSADGKALGGVVIEVRDQGGALITSNGPDGTSSTIQIDSETQKPYNYTLSVPAGPTYVVTATKTGFSCSPASRSVVVTTQVTTKGIDFSMEPLFTFSAAPSMVSTPYDYPSPTYTVSSLLGNIGGDSAFKFATWDLGRYIYYPTAPANTFRLGRGYWLGYSSNMALSTEGVSADPTQVFEIPLNPGWNMVGCPFKFDVDWTKVQVRTSSGIISHDTAVSTGKIGVAMYSFHGVGTGTGSYAIDYTLSPWVGYWVRAYEAVSLVIDPVGSRRSVKIASSGRAALLQSSGGWCVNLRADVGGASDVDNYIGVSPKASDGFDGYKMEKPPVFLSRYTALRIEHSNWGSRSADYGVDLRSSSGGQKTWDVAVDTNVANGTAAISWPNVASVGRGVTLTLTDLATGAVRDMRSSASYRWTTGDAAATRRFRITASRTAGTQLRVTGVSARSSRGTGTYAIGYTLSTSATVQIRVLSVTGSEVRTIGTGTTRAAGVNQATWDLKDARGVSVPAGVYMVEITAHSDDTGQTAKGTGPVTVIR